MPLSRRAATRLFSGGALAFMTSGCAGAPSAAPRAVTQTSPPDLTPPPAVKVPPAESAVEIKPGFAPWLAQLQADALGRGISKATVGAAFAGLEPIPRVLELDRRQPEFSQTFTRYLDGAVTPKRVADGQAAMKQHAAALRRAAQAYGVPERFLVAFWGLETNYGKGQGGYPVVAALATLAYDGRRADFFRSELFNALTIIDRGHIAPQEMVGSWAGAMGQTQFMPSTFLRYGVDADKDGRIDIWRDVGDAMSSAANYLKSLGWDAKRTWGREVVLPANFDVGLASIDASASETVKPLGAWSDLGVRQVGGDLLPKQEVAAALVLPAGRKGPAFLVYDNYRIILKWNRSMFYAIAVGHLADRLIGGPEIAGARQTEEPLRREEITALQEGLRKLGLLTVEADGVIGGTTRQAVRAFQRGRGLPPDGYAGRALLAAVAQASGVTTTP